MGDVLDYRNEFLYISESGLSDLACDTLAALAVSGSPERLFSSAGFFIIRSGTIQRKVLQHLLNLSYLLLGKRHKISAKKEPGVSHPAHDEYWHDEFFYGNLMKGISRRGGEFLFLQYISCP